MRAGSIHAAATQESAATVAICIRLNLSKSIRREYRSTARMWPANATAQPAVSRSPRFQAVGRPPLSRAVPAAASAAPPSSAARGLLV